MNGIGRESAPSYTAFDVLEVTLDSIDATRHQIVSGDGCLDVMVGAYVPSQNLPGWLFQIREGVQELLTTPANSNTRHAICSRGR